MGKMNEPQYTTAKLALASGSKPKRLAEIVGASVDDILRVQNTTNYKQYISDDTPTENILPQYWSDMGKTKTTTDK